MLFLKETPCRSDKFSFYQVLHGSFQTHSNTSAAKFSSITSFFYFSEVTLVDSTVYELGEQVHTSSDICLLPCYYQYYLFNEYVTSGCHQDGNRGTSLLCSPEEHLTINTVSSVPWEHCTKEILWFGAKL